MTSNYKKFEKLCLELRELVDDLKEENIEMFYIKDEFFLTKDGNEEVCRVKAPEMLLWDYA